MKNAKSVPALRLVPVFDLYNIIKSMDGLSTIKINFKSRLGTEILPVPGLELKKNYYVD
jgi:hypothetical protein